MRFVKRYAKIMTSKMEKIKPERVALECLPFRLSACSKPMGKIFLLYSQPQEGEAYSMINEYG